MSEDLRADVERARRQNLLQKVIAARKDAIVPGQVQRPPVANAGAIPESVYRIEKFPQYYQISMHRALAKQSRLREPTFLMHEGIARDTTIIGGRDYLNFGTYDYLGLNGDPRVNAAAANAAQRHGTSASASRIVSGERPPHRALEATLAGLHGTQDAIAFVSGYGTNLSVVSTLARQKDLVLLDRLIHNSVLQGARLSGATVQHFPHNDWQALDAMLCETRHRYERVLVVVEGIYSMDGDICPLDRFVEVKQRHKALLMIDEAHSIGVLGATGRGAGEHFGLAGDAVDVWMGTLSKSFAGCGGYVAGSTPLVELLKFTSPGFVFSVGMPPPIAAAAHAAIEIMLQEPERVLALRENGARFVQYAHEAGLDTGMAAGLNIVPIMIGRSVLAMQLSNALFDRGINVQPITFPVVEEKTARLRFFLSAAHNDNQIRTAVDTIAEQLSRLQNKSEDDHAD